MLNSVNSVHRQSLYCIYLNKYRSTDWVDVACVTSFVGRRTVGLANSPKQLTIPVNSGTPRYTLIRLPTMAWLKTELWRVRRNLFCLLALNGRKSCCWSSAVLKCNLNTC